MIISTSSSIKDPQAAQAMLAALGSRVQLSSLIQAMVVAEYLNVRHAASALGISQSSISARIKRLEQDLGILLFERRHRGVRLTEAGQLFLQHVATGVQHLACAIRTAGAVSRGEEGSLRVGLYSTTVVGFLANLFGQFRELYPAVDLQLTEGRARDAFRAVREATLDVAFVIGVPQVGDCHSKTFWTEDLVVALWNDHPLAGADGVRWRDLASYRFLARHNGAGPQIHEYILLRLADACKNPRIERFDVERDTIMSMVAQQIGITLTSEAMAHVSFPGVVFCPVIDEPEPIRFSAVWSPHNRSPTLHRFLTLAERRAKEIR